MLARLGCLTTLLCVSAAPVAVAAPAGGWTEAFEASPANFVVGPELQKIMGSGMTRTVNGTVRFIVTLAAGGSAVRVRLSNEDGAAPLRITAASVALGWDDAQTAAGAVTPLTFGGAASVVLPAGAPALSDPVPLATKPLGRIVVSLCLGQDVTFAGFGGAGMSVAPGDQTRAGAMKDAKLVIGRPLVSGVAVEADRALPVVVALGDSITDGARARPDALHGYPEELARRLAQARPRRAVVNAGIGGNRVVLNGWGESALARLDRDVLRLPGVTHLILLEGINDIGMSGHTLFGVGPVVSADEIIAGYRQIIARAHARGVKVVGATLTPFKGAPYYTMEKEQEREAVNQWIRTSGAFDGVIDFDAALRDPADPLKMRAELNSGDRLHPNDAGYKAMGDAIDLGLFR